MAAYKGHPAWLGKAMQSGGGVGSSDVEARQSAENRAQELTKQGANDLAGAVVKEAIPGAGMIGGGAGGYSGHLKALKDLGRAVGKSPGRIWGPIIGAGIGLAGKGIKDAVGSADKFDEAAKIRKESNERKAGGRVKKARKS